MVHCIIMHHHAAHVALHRTSIPMGNLSCFYHLTFVGWWMSKRHIHERTSYGTRGLTQTFHGDQDNGNFAQSVAISNGYVIIAANREQNNTGFI